MADSAIVAAAPSPSPPHSHADDETAGRVILWSLVGVMLVSQVGVIQWRRAHPRSYNLATLAALWLFPIGLLFSHGAGAALRAPFLYAWLLFSLLMGALLAAVRASAMDAATPGVVYGVLEAVYLQCMGVSSFVTTACVFMFLAPPLAAALPEAAVSLLVFAGAYAVYFAVLVRDMTGLISEVLVARRKTGGGGGGRGDAGGAGAAGSDAQPDDARSLAALRDCCALCGGKLAIVDEGTVVEEGAGDAAPDAPLRPIAVRRADGTIVLVGGARGAPAAAPAPRAPGAPATLRFTSADGKTIMFQLTCKHVFHRTCLAGWSVVGKKGVCPCCAERVDLGAIYADSPLIGKTTAAFGQLLEMARYVRICAERARGGGGGGAPRLTAPRLTPPPPPTSIPLHTALPSSSCGTRSFSSACASCCAASARSTSSSSTPRPSPRATRRTRRGTQPRSPPCPRPPTSP
jgi:hypothetical protein